jgi:uncharacterized protein (DUF2252 family)
VERLAAKRLSGQTGQAPAEAPPSTDNAWLTAHHHQTNVPASLELLGSKRPADADLDPVAAIEAYNRGRHAALLGRKYTRLRSSAFVFMRGTCHLFIDRLNAEGTLASAPLAWSCGDLHLENFGSYQGDNQLSYFDINDFDEAALAPCSWDVVRLLTSLHLAADDLALGRRQLAGLCERFTTAYAGALAQGSARWLERATARGLVKDLLGSLRERSRKTLLDRYSVTRGNRRELRLDPQRTLPVTVAERERVAGWVDAQVAAGHLEPMTVEDVAWRVTGTASLGLARYVVLVRTGPRSTPRYRLLDIKQAHLSSVGLRLASLQPPWATQAHRQVSLQQRLQAVSMAQLFALPTPHGDVVLRALQPSEDRIDLTSARAGPRKVGRLIEDMGSLLAWAHLRGSGRQGAASADALVDFGRDHARWAAELWQAASLCAGQTRQDWQAWCAAFDGGQIRT